MRLIVTTLTICVAAVQSFAASDAPRWSVRVSSDGHGYFIEQPNCHPLKYFLRDTARLNFHHYTLFHIEPGKTEDQANSRSIGEVGGYAIEQVSHEIDGGEFSLKMIVVGRGRNEFCEIYHQEWMAKNFYQDVHPAYLVRVRSAMILVTRDVFSGNGHLIDEHYWAFDGKGPIDLRVTETIRDIQKKLLTNGLTANVGGFDVENLTYDSPVWGPNDPRCFPSAGRIQIKFSLHNHQLAIVDEKFVPGGD